MEGIEILDSILLFVSKWVGTAVPRIATAFLGLLCAFVAVVGMWDRRIRALTGALGLSIGILMVLVALDPGVIHFLAQTSYYARIRILMTVLSFVVMVITLEAIRRSHLQERYAILWIATGAIILITAFFPQILNVFKSLLGTDYVAVVVGILFTFLLLIAFHFSISLSTLRKNQTQIAQRLVLLEQKIESLPRQFEETRSVSETVLGKTVPFAAQTLESEAEEEKVQSTPRTVKGTQVAAYILIPIVVIGVLMVGLKTPQPMVGDEVTHFFMLSKQADYLSKPNFYATIPMAYGETEVRRYPHPFLWHYLGAMLYRLSGHRFSVVQLYQALFWAQLLIFCYLLAKSRGGIQDRSALLYLVLIASLPVAIIFSVTFYQDVPMTAQVVTAFYLLRQRQWLASTLFLCFAIGLKVTAVLFLPAFLFLLVMGELKSHEWIRGGFRILCTAVILFTYLLAMEHIIKTHAEAEFYPVRKARELISAITKLSEQRTKSKIRLPQKPTTKSDASIAQKLKPVTPYEVEIIANHPGDLRITENYFVYGGIIIWIVFVAGTVSFACFKLGIHRSSMASNPTGWLFLVGLSYTLFAAFFLQTAPDARFFLPGLPFLLLPFAELTVRLPRPKLIIATLSALAVLQGGYVLAKTYRLRHVTPEIRQAISYLEENQPTPRTVFMYPEGNYRLFPVPHNWYLGYKLREFWRADNDIRIQMLHHFAIGAIVVKKHLIADVDTEITNLGVYPTFFVKDLRNDSRFEKVFENKGVIIFKVPPKEPSNSG